MLRERDRGKGIGKRKGQGIGKRKGKRIGKRKDKGKVRELCVFTIQRLECN